MAFKKIFTNAGTLDHKLGSIISGGTFTFVSTASNNVFGDNIGVFRGPFQYTFAGGNAPGFVPGTVQSLGPQTIVPTATFTEDDNQAVMREEDSGTMNAQGTQIASPSPIPNVPVPGVNDVEVSMAGQDNIEAE